ncbi:MAG TPA: sigma-70 family RNA polymerase sigma factor [Bryobacteraceae bacterium]|nr:sigma-70 family RNA polymerase sigma factor [Bryobacteraceae bacterium]
MGSNQAEFERIAMPHAPSLLRVARRMSSSAAAAEDLVQETLLSAWRGFHQFQPESNIRAWLFRILLNNSYAHGRKLRATPPTTPLVSGSRIVLPVLDDAMEVSRALQSLELDHRTVLLLGVVEGFTCREMAEILNVPIGTIMSRLSRARQAMRTRLTGRSTRVEYAAAGNLAKEI